MIIKSEVKTIHFVTFDNEWNSKITDGKLSEENLVQLSFRFLLDREPNTSILKKFKLNMISDFFPTILIMLNIIAQKLIYLIDKYRNLLLVFIIKDLYINNITILKEVI